MSDFITCPQGHTYDSELEECPYCGGKTIDNALEDLPEVKNVDKSILANLADCYFTRGGDI